MLIDCPQCNAQYNLPKLDGDTTPRRMKCAKCSHIFIPALPHLSIPNEMQNIIEPVLTDDLEWEEVTANPKQGSSEDRSQDGIEGQYAEVLQDKQTALTEDKDEKTSSKVFGTKLAYGAFLTDRWNQTKPIIRRLIALSRHRKATLAGGVLAPMAILAVLFTAQQSMVRHFPELVSLYELAGIHVNLRGLEIVDAHATERMENGVNVLVVNGTVRNLTEQDKALPPLQMVFQARHRTIYSWQHDWESASIAANGSKQFQVFLASPPYVAEELQLRFFR